MADIPVTTKFIDGAWLVYTPSEGADEVSLPLSAFTVRFAVGSIPTATVMPSIGFNLKTPKDVTTITGLRENLQVRVDFSQDKERITLIEGFVQQISLGEKATVFSRKTTVSVVVKHNVIRLAGAPPVSFRYTGTHAPQLQTLYAMNKTQLFIETGDESSAAPTDIFSQAAFVTQFNQALGIAVTDYPSSIFKGIVDFLSEEWALKRGMIDPDNLVRSYEPANLSQLGIAQIPVMQFIAKTFSKDFPNANAWEALVRSAQQLYLNVIPYNKGVYIANNISLMRDPGKKISAKEYVTVEGLEQFNTAEAVDGIAVLNPVARLGLDGTNSVLASYPIIGKGGTTEDDLTVAGRYYHFREFPQWLLSLAGSVYGPIASGRVTEENPGAAGSDNKPTQTADDYLTIAERVAKVLYAEARMTRKMLTVILPFRTDLMPGTTVAVQKPPHREDYFVSEDIYGHINETIFAGSLLGSKGELTTTIKIGSVRTETDNSETLTFVDHPIYQGKWVGIDLFGNHISDLPAHDPLPPKPTTTNNAITGKKIGTTA